jgi:hypothetical protein
MGTREFVKFVIFITGFIGLSAFVTMLFVYYATRWGAAQAESSLPPA